MNDDPAAESTTHEAVGGHAGSKRAIVAAFLANLGIAVAKFIGFAFTGAASMFAEGVHSIADTSNQGLLLLGARRARRGPTPQHPFGFGRERYFWAFVVAIVLFTAGALFALVEGEEKLRHPHQLESVGWAIGILAVSVVLESMSLRTAIGEARRMKGRESWWGFVRRSKSAELPVVLLEDTGALIGLALALAGVVLADITGAARFDALGSIGIGVLLAVIAFTLATEMKSLLIGESASKEQVSLVCDALVGTPHVGRILDLRTEHLGPEDILVVAKVVVDGDASAPEVLDDAERRVREAVPSARLLYLEPDRR